MRGTKRSVYDRAGYGGLLGVLLWACWSSWVAAATLPEGFQETVVFSGLTEPTSVRFAPDGRVFVAEKSGIIKVFPNLATPTPTVVADLRTNVHNYWDRGLLGFALDPQFPTRPFLYVLYTYDAVPGGVAPRWGTAGTTSDPCPNPPGATSDGCVVGGRLSRLELSGNTIVGAEQVLLEAWCQQFPSHSLGSVAFGPDGALYASAGDGASFNVVDYGQLGGTVSGSPTPANPCGDPPGAIGTALTAPNAMGGALRSQSLGRPAGPVDLDGTIIRVDPATGAALPDNPLIGHSDANARRIVAYGFRNPFRITFRPGTSELWVGDVGWSAWEEINRIVDPIDARVENFGWPCYEGVSRQPSYDAANLTLCENLYGIPDAVTGPYFAYHHSNRVVPDEACPIGSSAVAGLAFQFYDSGNYPEEYRGALFVADNSRRCIWAMLKDASGLPAPGLARTFVSGAASPVELQTGPGGDLFYVDLGGTVRRISYVGANNPVPSIASLNPSSAVAGSAAFTLEVNGSGFVAGSTVLWNGTARATTYDSVTRVRAAVAAGDVAAPGNASVIVANPGPGGGTSNAVEFTVGQAPANRPPVPTISAPAQGTQWKVGDTIAFFGSATDAEQGALSASALSWSLVLHHCPSNCHQHLLQTWTGESGGSFSTPDHEYPSYLELILTATDAQGLEGRASLRLDPRVVTLTFQTSPGGLKLTVDSATQVTSFTRTVIVGSTHTLSADPTQAKGKQTYRFTNWSDGGAATHTIVAPAAAATYTARYRR